MKANATVNDLIETQTKSDLPAIRPEALKFKRRLTLDATSIARLKQVICRVDGEIEEIDMPPMAQGAPATKAKAMPITDVVTNTQYLLIANSLIVSAMVRAGLPLAGKYFALRAGEIKAGKRYRQVEVIQLELAE